MRTIELRDEMPPDDGVVVVRGGQMNSEFVIRTASRTFDEIGLWTVSVFITAGSVLELCRSVVELERYGKVRLSNVGRLRSLGFVLIPTLNFPHFDVVLPDLDGSTLDRLELAFDVPIPNPAREGNV
jgi:hypothetical protein